LNQAVCWQIQYYKRDRDVQDRRLPLRGMMSRLYGRFI
jgi:hypothetical protein